jgi:4-hydroxy-3-methylbut-2-enyl diphosphate reductase
MEIVVAKHSGFCYGVKRAVEMALASRDEAGGAVTLGPIIHNPQMVEMLAQKGIGIAHDINTVDKNTVILRSHGVGPQVYSTAKEHGLKVVDATCPHVKKAQLAAKALNEQGYYIIIVGEKNHPEVKSIFEWSGEDVSIVENPEEASALPNFNRLGIVSQTTFSGALFEVIIAILRQKSPEIKINRTICNATDLRQSETAEIAKQTDIMIVVGGKNSANTTRLTEISKQAGCETYHIETAAELNIQWFLGKKSAGITAGASTPSWLIEEVYQKMQEFNEALDPALKTLEAGQIIQGKVAGIRKDEVFVDIGYKAEGVIPLAELAFPVPEKAADVVSEGQVIDVYVIEAENAEGNVKLSKTQADKIVAWDKLATASEKQETVEAKVVETVKGGVSASVFGIRGFIPASQMDIRYVEDLGTYVGMTVEALIIELDQSKQRVVLSRRSLLEKRRQEVENKIYESLTPGTVMKGKVSRITDFGAFIDIGGIEGLVHISDLSWERVKHPSDVVAIGDEVEVYVLKVDPKARRISLSLKQRQHDPWFDRSSKIINGTIVTGKVTKIMKFGAFVDIGQGMEGLVHLSELADRRVATAEEVVQPGQQVQVKILNVDKASKKISLSIKQAQEDAERAEYQKYLNQQPALSVTLGDKLAHLLKRED